MLESGAIREISESLVNERDQRVFTREDLSSTDAKLFAGKYKRALDVQIDSTGEACILKLPRIYELDSNVRNTEKLEKENADSSKLKKFIPSHVPAILGVYKGDSRDGLLVEKIEGPPLNERNGSIRGIPNEKQITKFFDALKGLAEDGVLIETDSLNPHNLALGKIKGNDEDEIILYEPTIIEDNPDFEGDREFTLKKIEKQRNILLKRAQGYLNQ